VRSITRPAGGEGKAKANRRPPPRAIAHVGFLEHLPSRLTASSTCRRAGDVLRSDPSRSGQRRREAAAAAAAAAAALD